MAYNFDHFPNTDRNNFVRYNPLFLKTIFGRDDLLPFWVADTDFQVMPVLREALAARAKSGLFGYETKSPDMKRALAKWYKTRYDIKIHPKKLLFMPSVNSSIAAIIDEFCQPSDGVIIQPPVFQMFKSIIASLDRKVVNNPLILKNNHYEINFDDLLLKAQDKSAKILLLCSPHNPVGRVWTADELIKIGKICQENNLLLITDEIHGDIIYSPNKYTGMLSIYSGLSENIIMVSSAGKSFGMPGLVDSFVFTPNDEYHDIMKARIERFHLDKSNAFANTAWQVVYEEGHEWLEQMTVYLKANINFIAGFLEHEIPQIKFPMPEGTYQIWLDFRELGKSNEALACFLVQDAGLALNQGSVYGPGGDGFMRMNIASPIDMLEQAMTQLKKAIENIT
jgi:cysteine-S-conjugate beta-lyase